VTTEYCCRLATTIALGDWETDNLGDTEGRQKPKKQNKKMPPPSIHTLARKKSKIIAVTDKC
jgi:hypothetical protein